MKLFIPILISALVAIQMIDAKSVDSAKIAEVRAKALRKAKLIQQLKKELAEGGDDDYTDSYEIGETRAYRSPSRHIATKSRAQQERSKEINKKFLLFLPFMKDLFG